MRQTRFELSPDRLIVVQATIHALKVGRYRLENGQKRISELFDGRKIFNIPKYQRAYAWEEQQLKDFVEDIENQKPDRSYFFGTILFQAQPRREGFEIIDIVDGQQRITTLSL